MIPRRQRISLDISVTIMKLAIPSLGKGGKRSRVSDVFSKASYFTFVEVEGRTTSSAIVSANESSGMTHGAGPVVAKILKEAGVDIVIWGMIGPGAKTLLEISGLEFFSVEPDILVSDAIQQFISSRN